MVHIYIYSVHNQLQLWEETSVAGCSGIQQRVLLLLVVLEVKWASTLNLFLNVWPRPFVMSHVC